MFFTKLTAAAVLAVTAVSAQIYTPAALYQCQPIQISWAPTTGPYYLSVIPGQQPGAVPLFDFGQVDSSPITWNVSITAGTSVGFTLVDATGAPKYSDALTIRPGSSDSCLSTSSSGAAGGAVSSGSSAVAGATSSAAAAVSSVAASGSSRVASASSAAGSMAASGASRAAGSQTQSAGSSTSTGPANGASKVESAGLIAAALAVVVAAAL